MTDSRFESCIRLICGGDKGGLKEIYSEYGRMIYSCMLQAVGKPQDAEDLTADFFLKLWKISDTYRGGNGHKRWLVTVARNMAADFLRKSGREQPVLDDDEQYVTEPSDEITPEGTVVGTMTVGEAMKELTSVEREIVGMKLFAELTFSEIAGILKKPVGTVAWKYRGAISKLQRLVKEVQD